MCPSLHFIQLLLPVGRRNNSLTPHPPLLGQTGGEKCCSCTRALGAPLRSPPPRARTVQLPCAWVETLPPLSSHPHFQSIDGSKVVFTFSATFQFLSGPLSPFLRTWKVTRGRVEELKEGPGFSELPPPTPGGSALGNSVTGGARSAILLRGPAGLPASADNARFEARWPAGGGRLGVCAAFLQGARSWESAGQAAGLGRRTTQEEKP